MEGFASTDAIIFPEDKCQCCDICASDCACLFCQLPEAYLHYQMPNLEELLSFDQSDEEHTQIGHQVMPSLHCEKQRGGLTVSEAFPGNIPNRLTTRIAVLHVHMESMWVTLNFS